MNKKGKPAEDFFAVYKDKRILVTGGGGYIAQGLVQTLKNIPCRIIRLYHKKSRLPSVFPEAIAEINDVAVDIRKKDLWLELLPDVDFVFHLAAQTSAYTANQNPVSDLSVNVFPMLHLLECCRNKGYSPIIIFAGTVTETGLTEKLPVNETRNDRPVTIYDLHKLTAERYLYYYTQQKIVRGTTLRLSNVYGPGPGSSASERGVVNRMIAKAIRGENIPVYEKGDFMRDYIFLNDAVNAFLTAGVYAERLKEPFYIIGSGGGFTIADVMTMIARRVTEKTKQKPKVVHVPPSKNLSIIEFRNFVADTTLFRTATGWSPQIPLSEGIDRTIDFFLNNTKGLK